MSDTFYDLLGISRKVNREEMRLAFFTRAARVHPLYDRPGDSAQFKLFAEAFAILYDAKTRFRYDAHLKSVSTEMFRIPLGDDSAVDLFNSISVEVAYVHARDGKSMDEIADALVEDGCPEDIAMIATKLAVEPIHAEARRKLRGRLFRTGAFVAMILPGGLALWVKVGAPAALAGMSILTYFYYRIGAPIPKDFRNYAMEEMLEPSFKPWPGRKP